MAEHPEHLDDAIQRLHERNQKLAAEKSRLTLINEMYHYLIRARGVDEITDALLNLALQLHGGSKITLYYCMQHVWYYKDTYGRHGSVDVAQLPMVRDTVRSKTFLDRESRTDSSSFLFTDGTPPRDIPDHTTCFPLLVDETVIAVLKIDGRTVYNVSENQEYMTFYKYAALVLNNKLLDYNELQHAYEKIRRLNEDLEQRVRHRTARLEMANQELQSFAYAASHDLKAPLRGISRLADWIVQDYAATVDEKGKEMLALMIGRITRMDNLIDGILQYSRIGRVAEHLEPVDLQDLIREIIEDLAPPDHINITIEGPLPTITGSKVRFGQLFQNLLSNAIKFTEKAEGHITLSCRDREQFWEFRVKDNGPGIEQKYHAKVFQMFQTLTPRDVYESTGIGLTLVKKIVELYGGTVWIESTPGHGSTFACTLPKTFQTPNAEL